jgi:hypothetical protein
LAVTAVKVEWLKRLFAVVADRVLRAHCSGFFRSSGFLGRGRLLVEVDVGFAVVVLQDRVDPTNFHAGAAGSAGVVNVPWAGNVLG